MTKTRRGFTIIEVTLFLAVSGLLMVGLIAGTTRSISRQRYAESVETFAETLRAAYSDVVNVQNYTASGGRSGTAIYGKLITIGEAGTGKSELRTYTIIGDATRPADISNPTADTLAILKGLNLRISAAGAFVQMESFTLPWEATMEKTGANTRFRGAIFLLRSPISGTVHTYHAAFPTPESSFALAADGSNFGTLLNLANESSTTDVCVDSEDNSYGRRRDVRVQTYAANSNGVFMVGLNDDDNKCGGSAQADKNFSGDTTED